MNRIARRLSLASGLTLAAAGWGLAPTPAHAEATVIDCSLAFPGVDGVIIITPNGQVRANCHEHILDQTGGSTGGGAITVDCVQAIGNDGPGIEVITPSGNTLVNCHVHAG